VVTAVETTPPGLGCRGHDGPRTLAARATAATAARQALGAEVAAGRLRRVQLLMPDPHARFAAVDLDGTFFHDQVLDHGYGACTYVLAWDVERRPTPAPALQRFYGPFGDLVLRPDLATLTPRPDEPGAWMALSDASWRDGAPVAVAPRHVLRAQLAEGERLGLVPSVGIEHEVTFLDTGGRPLSDHGIDYALGGTERMAPVMSAVGRALAGAGLGVESARAECHAGQYEVVLGHRDALAACDDAMLQQLLVRQAAARSGVVASYLAAEEPGQGSSCHVHLSLSDPHGRPLGADPGDDRRPSAVLASFLAGVLVAAGDLTAVWAPTVNGHVRLRTAPFAPRQVRWGVDDRTAAIRLAGHGASLRLEFRCPGADAQPHLVVGALLAAGLAGVREGRQPPPAGEAVDELSTTPWRSLDRLTDSPLPRALLGDAVVDHYAALLAAEIDAWCDSVTGWQRRRSALRS